MKATRFLIWSIPLIFLCCSSQPEPPASVQGEMRDIYSTAKRLYQLIWSPEVNQGSDEELIALLDRLSQDFHRAERFQGLQGSDPTFPIVLETTQSMLYDARTRLAAGARDYAVWRLRGLSANCIACHSRYQVDIDFVGDTLLIDDNSVSAKLNQAEFLVATRQFSRAEAQLRALAKTFAMGGDLSQREMFRVLKLWLVVEVRVKDTPSYSSSLITELLAEQDFAPDLDKILRRWEADLKTLSAQESPAQPLLTEAETHLEKVRGNVLFYTDELNLVHTLRAEAVLHQLLRGNLPVEKRRKATLLLGVAYMHTPIRVFEAYRDLYLERCIKEFPNTKEAQEAYELLAEEIDRQSTGSAGLNIDPADEKRLQKLRLLAYGMPEIRA